MGSSSSAPRHSRSSNGEDERPRFFDSKTRSKCWDNAEILLGRHPESGAKTLLATSSASVCSTAKVASASCTIILFPSPRDVTRPGNQCLCRTVAEMLGKYKSKDNLTACKLPNDKESV
ncbi:hypothetical protein CRYUN_Cryun19dG0032100 [Craigia yunnanensis]